MNTLLKFSSYWCQPCHQLSRTLSNLTEGELTKVPAFSITEINVDKEQALAKDFNVCSIPTLVLLDSTGEEIRRSTGALTKDQLVKFLGDTQ